jgi:Fibronectin type III domain
VQILCAAVPLKPLAPTTTLTANQVIFDWSEPVANGKPITGYKVYIRRADLSYVVETSLCNGLDATVTANTQCTVPLSKLTAAPFSLFKGYGVFIKVAAVNSYGDSVISDAGSGAFIVLVPDAPVNLANNPSKTSKTVISFTWEDGESDGDRPIIDYRITYDKATSNFVVLDTGIVSKSYTTSVVLIAGRTYVFKVEARNSVGYSAMSAEVSILAATIPGKPSTPTTSISDNNVAITWSVPDDGNAPINGYIILIR